MKRVGITLALALWLTTVGVAAGSDDQPEFAFRPHPGGALPLTAALRDEGGEPVTLGRFFTGAPVVLVLEYLRCKTLCGVTLGAIVTALDGLTPTAGRDFRLVAISIDPRDTAADANAAKAKYLALYHRPEGASGVHFLTGSADTVRQIADRVGFPYRYDPELDQYIHPAGFIVATPDGRISRYIFGLDFGAADLQQAIADAARSRAIGPVTRLLLLCRGTIPAGRYTVPVLAAFALVDLAGMAGLVAVFAAIRRRRHG